MTAFPDIEAVAEDRRARHKLVARLEQNITYGGIGISLLVIALFVPLVGSRPVVIPLLWLSLGTLAWYSFILLLIRRGAYRAWLRYVSSALEATFGSIVILIDLRRDGALGAATSAGVVLYAFTVATNTLRLDPRLPVFSGAVAAAQFLAIFWFIAPPALDPRLAGDSRLTAGFAATAIKAVFIGVTGVIGSVGATVMRRLLTRATARAEERERVRDLFSLYASEEVVDALLAGRVRADGERRLVTILCADIRGFTAYSESRPPEEILACLNAYFDRMCAVVARHRGLVNKFLGDGMLCVFGAPLALEDDAGAAFAAAREMVVEASRLVRSGEFPDLRIAIGIHRGEAVVGSLGGSQRREYAVFGDAVVAAARVETLAKQLDRQIVLSEPVRAALAGAGAADVDPLGEHELLSIRTPGATEPRGRAIRLALFAPRA